MRQRRKNLRNGLLFVMPWLIGFSFFLAYPTIASLYYSLSVYDMFTPPKWNGFGNYWELFHDPIFWISLSNTFYYAIFAIPLGQVIALLLALLLNTKVKAMPVFRTIYFLPTIVPPVVIAILWLWIFNTRYGVLNALLAGIGIRGPNWLGDPAWAKPALILMSFWTVGQPMIIYLAGLQDVPQQLYEAAELDGANWWQKTLRITLPMVSPAMLLNVIIGLIWAMQIFTLPYIMTGGGPMRATTFYALYLYENAFQFFKMGYASAMAWLLFIIILTCTLIIFKISSKKIYYAGK
ncbi:MAG: sugar ABC transporter permease [Spirochaetes bacterium]|nr:MAG: sugar ABC transporter permease [Spirochaetota bacterium]